MRKDLTEVEWLLSQDPEGMLITFRKLREKRLGNRRQLLIGAAVFRTIWEQMSAPCMREAVHLAEVVADEENLMRGHQHELSAATNLCSALDDHQGPFKKPYWGVASLWISGPSLDAVFRHSGVNDLTQCALVREVLGNLFREPRLARLGPKWAAHGSEWKVPYELAQTIYHDKQFDLMPMLADTLEEAGCTDEQVLWHCRGWEACPWCLQGVHGNEQGCGGHGYGRHRDGRVHGLIRLRAGHCRGCYVLDRILGLGDAP